MAGMVNSEYPAPSGPILVKRGRLPYGYLAPFTQAPGIRKSHHWLLIDAPICRRLGCLPRLLVICKFEQTPGPQPRCRRLRGSACSDVFV